MSRLRAIAASRRKGPVSKVDKQPAKLFRSACPPSNLPKIITIYASTSVGEFQGLAGCGRIVLRRRTRGTGVIVQSSPTVPFAKI